MAGKLYLPELDLTCAVCCEIFRDPVVLKCSHSFCASCLQQYWSRQRRNRDCPLCRTQSVDDPVPSLTLKNLCESYTHESEEPEETAEELPGEPGELCPHHGERLKLYCLSDKVPICVVCHTSRKHKQHECCPVSEAIVDVKVNISLSWSNKDLRLNNDAFFLGAPLLSSYRVSVTSHYVEGCYKPKARLTNLLMNLLWIIYSGENEVHSQLTAGEEGGIWQNEEELWRHCDLHSGVVIIWQTMG